ncbi:MAG TPA: DUF1508 domain-containing protein [Prosthecobacter sp.]|nr:DUF1508 domain-containing protein [Prosthecobacter sp.]
MKYVIYKDVTGLWRWRFVTNGRTIADSAESYHNKQDEERGIQIMKGSGNAPTEGPQPRGLLDI